MTHRALVIGCGGTMGGAWSIGVLDALSRHLGWDPADAAVLQGTSAGGELSMLLAAGYSPSELVDMLRGQATDPILRRHFTDAPRALPPRPRRWGPASAHLLRAPQARGYTAAAGLLPEGGAEPTWLRATARDVTDASGGWVDHDGVRLVAMNYDTGSRVAFGRDDAPPASLEDAVCATWSVPGWMAPTVIDGRRYVDGGTASTASLDLLLDDPAMGAVEEVLVITSMASLDRDRVPGVGGRVENLLRRRMTAVLASELEALRRTGRRVTVVDADAASLATLGANFMAHRRRDTHIDSILADAEARVATVLGERQPRRAS